MPLPPPRSHAKASSVPTLSQDISTSVTSIAAAFWRQADLRLRRRAPRPQLHRSQLRRSQQLRRRVSTTYSWFTPLARVILLSTVLRGSAGIGLPGLNHNPACARFYSCSARVRCFTPQHTRWISIQGLPLRCSTRSAWAIRWLWQPEVWHVVVWRRWRR